MGKNKPPTSRARSDSAKEARRAALLAIAQRLVREVGYEKFSMNLLARESELAKGTLYLYFGSREEVLLALYDGAFDEFCEALEARLTLELNDEAFVDQTFEVVKAHPYFLELHARLESSIEENVSLEALIATKLATARRFDALGARTATALKLPPQKAAILLMGISTLILGTQSKNAKSLLNSASLPSEILKFQSHFGDDRGFKTLTSLLLIGLRADTKH